MGKGAKKQHQQRQQEGSGAHQKESARSKLPAGPPTTHHKDLYQRVNFTLQASAYLQQLQPTPSSTSSSYASSSSLVPKLARRKDAKGKSRAVEVDHDPDLTNGIFAQLARAGMGSTRKMVEHNQIKLDPTIKRNICKVCSTVLVPGLTARVRIRPNRSHINVCRTICLICSSSLTIPCPPTSNSPDLTKLDGPIRARRRTKVMNRSKIAFHEREKSEIQDSRKAVPDMDKGHVLWRGDEVVHGWGERSTRVEQCLAGA